jgi:hypothetical protein
MPSMNEPVLTSLFAQIEHEWEERGDTELVEKLAEQYPQYADDLFAFFDAILSEDDELPAGAGAAAVRDTLEWLKEEHAAARAERAAAPSAAMNASGPSPPQDLLGFLCSETNKAPRAVAAEMEDTTVELLLKFSEYPQLVPAGARRAVALRAHRGLGVDPEKIRRKFDDPTHFAMAASRTGAYGTAPATYEELLDRAALSPDLRARWLAFARDVEAEG